MCYFEHTAEHRHYLQPNGLYAQSIGDSTTVNVISLYTFHLTWSRHISDQGRGSAKIRTDVTLICSCAGALALAEWGADAQAPSLP